MSSQTKFTQSVQNRSTLTVDLSCPHGHLVPGRCDGGIGEGSVRTAAATPKRSLLENEHVMEGWVLFRPTFRAKSSGPF